MTRVLLNHFLLGSTRATGATRDWYEAALVMSPLALRWALPSVRRLRTLTFLPVLRRRQCQELYEADFSESKRTGRSFRP